MSCRPTSTAIRGPRPGSSGAQSSCSRRLGSPTVRFSDHGPYPCRRTSHGVGDRAYDRERTRVGDRRKAWVKYARTGDAISLVGGGSIASTRSSTPVGGVVEGCQEALLLVRKVLVERGARDAGATRMSLGVSDAKPRSVVARNNRVRSEASTCSRLRPPRPFGRSAYMDHRVLRGVGWRGRSPGGNRRCAR